MSELISKEDFARLLSTNPELATKAYNECPVRCSTCFEWCVSTIKNQQCRRFADFQHWIDNPKKMEEKQ